MSFFNTLSLSAKGIARMVLFSRPVNWRGIPTHGSTLIVMGNGPSLAQSLAEHKEAFERCPLLAVNFAANTDEFFALRPSYYLMADPVFFNRASNENVERLWQNLAKVSWPMTLFVPRKADVMPLENIDVRRFNFVGVEGASWLRNFAYSRKLAMPRPRNVLIPSIMSGLWMGYRNIYITGADHSWTKTLDVNERNEVVSIQPHFYSDNDAEHKRVASVYKNIRLHELLLSFHIAFKAYFDLEAYARHIGANLYNATPGSFIDAFERRSLQM